MRWLFPEKCLGCGKLGAYFCPYCLAHLPRPADEVENGVVALAYADKRVKKAIWLLKYGGARSLAGTFGQLIYDALGEYLAETSELYPNSKPWLVLPIPITNKRRRERGFNQAEEIAKALVKIDPKHFTLNKNLLIKIKETPTQVSIKNRTARLENLRDAFAITKPDQIRKQKIIILDDVITTGGTTTEARKILQQAGASEVIVTAVAHG